MSSRALSLATVLLLVGFCAVGRVEAQENLDAGKTPSQIFAGTCTACHKSPRGLLKTVPPGSLASFLRQHYTTSPNMAGVLASYLVSNGAADTRLGEAPRGAKGAREGAKQEARQEPRQEGRQEGRPGGSPEQLDRWGRRLHPGTAPQEAAAPANELKPDGETPAQAAGDRGPDGRKGLAKQRLSKRGRPSETLPKEEPATAGEPPKPEPKPESKPESKPSETAAKEEDKPASKPDAPAEQGRSQSAKAEQPAETGVIRPDPVPQVTPAPTAAPAATPAGPAPDAAAPSRPGSSPAAPVQAAVSSPATEMAVPLPAAATPPAAPPAVAASAPPQPPVPPAGPPAPPISQ